MIFALAATILAGGPSFVDVPDANAKATTVQAVVMLPTLSDRERELLPVIVRAMRQGSASYTPRLAREMSDGNGMTITLMPDHVRFGITVSPLKLADASAIVDDFVFRPRLARRDIEAAIKNQEADPWNVILFPPVAIPSRIDYRDVADLQKKVFRPENLTFATGGITIQGGAKGRWDVLSQRQHVSPQSPDYLRIDSKVSKPPLRSVIEMSEPVKVVSPADLLALIALGSGKGSTLFQTVRQRLGVSYRQEAILSPSPSGFNLRLIVVGDPKSTPTVRDAILGDIEGWTDVQRNRALGMARAIFEGGSLFGPMLLSGPVPLSNSLADRTFLAAYWQAKTGSRWNTDDMLRAMANVQLEDYKAAAVRMVRT